MFPFIQLQSVLVCMLDVVLLISMHLNPVKEYGRYERSYANRVLAWGWGLGLLRFVVRAFEVGG